VRNLGAAIAGGGGTRRADDFYPTPPEAVEALLESRWAPRKQNVWEPACGDGAISKVLLSHGYTVISTDLVDRGYTKNVEADFLQVRKRLAPRIVTNPPFKLAEQFIRHGFALGVEYQAHLLKAQFWNAASRLQLFKDYPPQAVMPLTWRLDFTGGGAPTMDCAWVVWETTGCSTTVFEPLARPIDPFAA